MATGDIANNMKKLRTKLKAIKYTDDLDVKGLAEGLPTAYLPIYHYVFTVFSPSVTKIILDKGIELYGKSDARFMEAVYKILRDVFAYKPSITKQQFFSKGFAERKVIMCADILQLVKVKEMELNPSASKTTMKTHVRLASACTAKVLPQGEDKTRRPTSVESQTRQVPQVINELNARPPVEPYRHLSSSAIHNHPVRHTVTHDNSMSSSESSDLESIPQKPPQFLTHQAAILRSETKPVKHVSIVSPREDRVTPLVTTCDRVTSLDSHTSNSEWNTDDFQDSSREYNTRPMAFMTPSIRKVCTKSVEIVSIPAKEYDDGDPSIVEIRAPTNDSVLHSHVPTVRSDLKQQNENDRPVTQAMMDCFMETILSKMENLTARMVMIENRMTIIESKISDKPSSPESSKKINGDHNLTYKTSPAAVSFQINEDSEKALKQHNHNRQPSYTSLTQNTPLVPDPLPIFDGPGTSFAEELRALPHSKKSNSLLKENIDFSLNYSPIRKITNGVAGSIMTANEDTFALETEDDARRSSTPTTNGDFLGESSIHCDISHVETKDTVSRIQNMMKETKLWLTEKPTVSQQEGSNTES
ncbi:Centrosomal protein of 44 kDa [Mactra antiquata]